ncbi:MAG: AAA family ATPase [Candidatus Manganitrophaceae bacterium]
MNFSDREVRQTDLSRRFDPESFPFKTTEELPDDEIIIGQKRAVRAIDFGLHIEDSSYNLFVAGIPGTGKNTIVKSMIRPVAEKQPPPDDWGFVYNFSDPDRPKVIRLSAGRGRTFQHDVDRLIASLKEELPKVFQSKEYEDQRQLLEEGFSKMRDSFASEMEARAREYGFTVNSTRLGMVVVPIVKGKPLEPEEIENLDPASRAEIEQREKALHGHIHHFVQQVRTLREEVNKKVDHLNQRVVRYASEHAFENLRDQYRVFPKVMEHLDLLFEDILKNFADFLPQPEAPVQLLGMEPEPGRKAMTRYAVNVAVDNSGAKGAPLIEETNPTYHNLIGRIKKRGRFGTLITDFTLIKAGSLLQANGGYLLLNILDLLRNPFSWDALKRTLKGQELKIEDIGEAYGIIATAGIKPEPIPIRLRVILVGNPFLYYLLHAYDEDFGKLFKVKVDFDVEHDRIEEAPLQYGRFIARLCRKEGLLHFDRSGVAALLEQAARAAGHQKKLSLQFSDLSDMVREASHWAKREGIDLVSRSHILKAVEEKSYRSNLLEEKIHELIDEGTLMVDVEGAVVGQINGLSIYDLGDFIFGRPSRITARVFLGESGIINIEREARLSGKTHSKGVLILSGYLGGRYGGEFPISISASLCFEQNYSEVDGDSASAAELIALLSGLTQIPLRQGIAITGSLNQRGEVQAIGGVNEKIEGFYAVCKTKGLTGNQGVIIPRANCNHLMLKEEVVEAVAAGRFHVYTVSNVDEAIEILTGKPAGTIQPDGTYPEGTINRTVIERLQEITDKLTGEDEPPQTALLPASLPLIENNAPTPDQGASKSFDSVDGAMP